MKKTGACVRVLKEDGGNAAYGIALSKKGAASPSDSVCLAGATEFAGQVAAADDAWIHCVVLLEKLQEPSLAPSQVAALLTDLAMRYARFRQASRLIEQLVADDLSGP